MTPRFLLPLAATLGVAACGPTPGDLRRALLQSLVGHGEADAVRALGVPNRTVDADNRRFLEWDTQSQAVYPGVWGYGWGPPWYGGVPPVVVARGCQTVLELAGGRVVSWTERGDGCP